MATTPANPAITEALPPIRFLMLSARAGEVFANHEKAMGWLQTPNPSLHGRTPIEAAKSEEGFAQVDEALARIEHGVLG